MIPSEVRQSAESAVLCWLATVDAAGAPNVSPKEVFVATDDAILIANIASPGSSRNLSATGRACVSFVDVFVQRGWKISGRADVIARSDTRFASLAAPLEAITGGDFPFDEVFLVEAEHFAPIVAPSIVLFPERTADDRIAEAMRRYGVRPS